MSLARQIRLLLPSALQSTPLPTAIPTQKRTFLDFSVQIPKFIQLSWWDGYSVFTVDGNGKVSKLTIQRVSLCLKLSQKEHLDAKRRVKTHQGGRSGEVEEENRCFSATGARSRQFCEERRAESGRKIRILIRLGF